MGIEVVTTIFFTDSSKMTLTWPQQAGEDPNIIAMNVRKALDQDKLAMEVDGDLIIIPMENIKYIQITPAPSDYLKMYLSVPILLNSIKLNLWHKIRCNLYKIKSLTNLAFHFFRKSFKQQRPDGLRVSQAQAECLVC